MNDKSPFIRFLSRQRYVLIESDMSYTEELFSVCYIGWGLILTFFLPNLLAHNKSYGPMADLFDQSFWGLWFLFTGILKFSGSALFDVWTTSLGKGVIRFLRTTGALMGTFIWTFIAFMFSLTGAVPTAIVVYTTFAITCFLTVIRYIKLDWLFDSIDWIIYHIRKRLSRGVGDE